MLSFKKYLPPKAGRSFLAAFYFSVLFLSKPATAESHQELSIGVFATDFRYREADQNDLWINKENGSLQGWSLGAAVNFPSLFLQANWQQQNGKVNYTANSVFGPLGSHTKNSIDQWQLQLGKKWVLHNQFAIAPTAAIGFRYWQRNILSTSSAAGLDETYRWPYFSVGVISHYQLSPRHRLDVVADWREIRQAELSVAFKSNLFDKTTLELPRGDGYALTLAWQFEWRRDALLRVSSQYQYWDLPRSKPVALYSADAYSGTTAVEPASETDQLSLAVEFVKRL